MSACQYDKTCFAMNEKFLKIIKGYISGLQNLWHTYVKTDAKKDYSLVNFLNFLLDQHYGIYLPHCRLELKRS